MKQSKRTFGLITLVGYMGLFSLVLAQELNPNTVTLKWKPGDRYDGQDNQELNLL